VIPADLHEVDRVCAEARVCLQELNLDEHNFAVQILLREALNNAVIHGCDSDPTRQVRCELSIDGDWLRISVEDDGPGFDWAAVLQRKQASQDQECGRGLLVYQYYADQIDFNLSGSRILLSRALNKTSHNDSSFTSRIQEEKE
jgi:serine/threonine-protein kinase RsbW